MNESSLFLQMNPAALVNGTKQFPIEIYEPMMDMVDGNYTRLVFIKTSYKLETGEAERIAIDHVAKPSSTTSDTSLGNARTTVVLHTSQMILIFISSCLSSNNSKKRNRNATF